MVIFPNKDCIFENVDYLIQVNNFCLQSSTSNKQYQLTF
jgi:hypothetical protein